MHPDGILPRDLINRLFWIESKTLFDALDEPTLPRCTQEKNRDDDRDDENRC